MTDKHTFSKPLPVAQTIIRGHAPQEADLNDLIAPDLNLVAEITRLKKEKNAIVLAHYYQESEIQEVADFVGDSLDLSRKAASTDADVIVFCGVCFMAEVAKILSPTKTVLVPDENAGCSLEESCQPEDFYHFRQANPDHLAITYINCSAQIKALSDIIVTSTNAKAIVDQIPSDTPLIFAPDKYLGAYVQKMTGRENMLIWPGSCIVHEQFSEKELVKLKALHPEAKVAAHPECPATILDLADHVGSTSSLLRYTQENPAQKFIIATEPGIMHQMQKASPDKEFIGAPGADGQCSCNTCPFMALNTMEKLYLALKTGEPEITVPESLRTQALDPLQRMLEMSPQ
ncbi:MAG: quinolinate synthase NadA [Alphaproteobacteria bacterium]